MNQLLSNFNFYHLRLQIVVRACQFNFYQFPKFWPGDEMDLYSLVNLFDSPAVELRSDYLRTFLLWRKAYGEHSFLTLSFNELL